MIHMQKLLLILAGVVALGAGCTTTASPQTGAEPAAERAAVLDAMFEDYSGNDATLADFAGTPLVVNSWAIWCPFCVEELKDFAAVQQEFGSSVTIIAINRAESRERTKTFLEELGVWNALTFWLDPRDRFYQSIGGFSMPETIFISANGEIADHKRGFMDAKEMRQRIQKAFDL